MRLPHQKWPDTDGSRGILLFAQLMSDMLTPSTFESFRVYSLDTIARIYEATKLIKDVQGQRVPRAVLDPVIDELKWSFSKDTAARSLASPEVDAFIILLGTSFSLDELSSHLILLEKIIARNYKESIERLLIDTFDRPDRRMEFRKLVGFYCSHLVNMGYERNYVRSVVDRTFFEKVVIRMGRGTLGRFLRHFDGKDRRYTVHIGVTRDLGKYLKGLGYVSFPRTPDGPYDESINRNYNANVLTHVFEWVIDSLDPFGAMSSAYQFLSGQRAISFLDPFGMHCEWGDAMHVTLQRAKSGQTIAKTDFLENKSRHPNRNNSSRKAVTRAHNISNYASEIMKNFDENSTERLLSSIRTAALARTSFSPENRLISLWSAIEVLLSEPREVARIVHYVKLIVPCIVMRHTRRQVIAIYNDLLPRYRSRLNKIIRDLNTSSLGPNAFAELIFLSGNNAYQRRLCDLLADNPLALHRVFKLQRDYKTIGDVNRTLDDHYNRVSWQIHRIYRARNQLVHAGFVPSYLESIILNLAEYYRSAIVTIVGRARKESLPSDIDQIVSEIGITYRILRGSFSKNSANTALGIEQIGRLMNTA